MNFTASDRTSGNNTNEQQNMQKMFSADSSNKQQNANNKSTSSNKGVIAPGLVKKVEKTLKNFETNNGGLNNIQFFNVKVTKSLFSLNLFILEDSMRHVSS